MRSVYPPKLLRRAGGASGRGGAGGAGAWAARAGVGGSGVRLTGASGRARSVGLRWAASALRLWLMASGSVAALVSPVGGGMEWLAAGGVEEAAAWEAAAGVLVAGVRGVEASEVC